jgi:tetratricopeptide (TPR) repeat protein
MYRKGNPILRALACALLVCAGAGCESDQQKLQNLLERAEASKEAGKYKEALIDLKVALQLAPQSGDINFRLARTLSAMKQPDNALFFYEEAFRLDPSLDEARLAAARIVTTSDPARAGELLGQVLERDPSNARAVSARANLELVKNDVPAALESALLATQLAPDDHVGWTQLGRVYQAQVQLAMSKGAVPPDATYAAALAAFDKARAASKGAGAEGEDGDDADGVASMIAFERARIIAAWPGHATEARDAYIELLETTHASSDEKRFRSARSVALYFAGTVGDAAIARAVVERVVALDPSYVWAWTVLARVEESQGGSTAAVYDRLVEQRPKDADAHIARADDRRRQGRSEEAVRDVLASISQVEEPARLRGYAVDLLDEVGRKDEATALLSQLEREAPEGTPTRIAQAMRAMREGRPADAVSILEPLAAGNEKGVQMILADAQLRLRNLPAATAALDRAYELSGGVLPAGSRLRFAIAREGKDWTGLLRIAGEMERTGARLSINQELSVAEAFYEIGREPEGRARLEAIVARGNPTPRTRIVYMQREGRRDPARARQLLEEGLAQHPQSLELLRGLTMLDLAEKRGPAALARLDAAIAARSASPEGAYLHLLRGRLRLASADLAGAQADALAAFRGAPQRPDIADFLGEVAMRRGEAGEAIAALEEVDRRGQLPRPSRTTLARLYGAGGRDEDAIRILEAVVAEGGGPIPKNELAYLLAKHGRDLERAMTLAKEVVAADATKSAYLDTLGFAYLQRKLYAPALAQFDRAIELADEEKQPRPEYHYRRGLALQGLERKDDARKEFETALSLDPGFRDAQHARASLDQQETTATP